MKLWFGGGEVAAHRKLLVKCGVDRIAVNLSAYFQQRQPLTMNDEVYGGFEIVIYSSTGGLDPVRVDAFIAENIELIDWVYGLSSDAAIAADKYVPEWSGGNINDLYDFAEMHERFGLAEAVVLDPALMTPIKAFVRSRHLDVWLNSSKTDAVGQAIWSDVIASGWLNAQRQRELQVWDGKQVSRYNRDRRVAAAEKHRAQIERLGHTAELVVDQDVHETMELAVTSWRQYERIETQVVATDGRRRGDASAPDGQRGLAISAREPVQRDRMTIPVIELREAAVDEFDKPVPESISSAGTMLRSCDPCSLNPYCPQYKEGHACGYKIPVSIKTKDELQATFGALLEMQAQRTFMARFAEDMLSQGLDDRVSAELERFFRMAKMLRDINDNRETIVITAKSKAEGGALSRVFGERVGAAQMELTHSSESDDIVDAIEVAFGTDT